MAVNNYAFKILALSYKFVINKIEILSLSRKREVPSKNFSNLLALNFVS